MFNCKGFHLLVQNDVKSSTNAFIVIKYCIVKTSKHFLGVLPADFAILLLLLAVLSLNQLVLCKQVSART